MNSSDSLQLPQEIVNHTWIYKLDYLTDDYLGIFEGLNEVGQPDYIVQSDPALCGNTGCSYLLLDGQNQKYLG